MELFNEVKNIACFFGSFCIWEYIYNISEIMVLKNNI